MSVGVEFLDGLKASRQTAMSKFEIHDGQVLSWSQDAACRGEEVTTLLLDTNENDQLICSHHRCERLILPVQPMC